GKDAKDAVQEKWQPFIFDNLLFYTILFELFLSRLAQPAQPNRLLTTSSALSPSRELRQLRKVLDVYQTENLKKILKIGEQVIVMPETFTESSFHTFDSADGGRDATSAFLASAAVSMPSQLYQLEGPQFNYEALFLTEGVGRQKTDMFPEFLHFSFR
ncbi:hypothetical protein BGZ94_006158, partial [Podila epigama]